MGMRQRLMPMGMGVRLAPVPGEVMFMLMMGVVHVPMAVE